jgi:hypothetical protein
MPTKYELQTQLRELTRGTKPLPIGKMKKAELERELALRSKLAEEREALGPAPKAKPGPLGPRRIPVIPVATDDVVIRTPKAPAKRPVSHKEARSIGAASTLADDSRRIASHKEAMEAEEEAVGSVFPAVAKAAKIRAPKVLAVREEEERMAEARSKPPAPKPEPKAAGGAGVSLDASNLRSHVLDILKALAAE